MSFTQNYEDKQRNEILRQIKVIVGEFHEEMKSNSMTDFIVWLDCKNEYSKQKEHEMEEIKNKAMKR